MADLSRVHSSVGWILVPCEKTADISVAWWKMGKIVNVNAEPDHPLLTVKLHIQLLLQHLLKLDRCSN